MKTLVLKDNLYRKLSLKSILKKKYLKALKNNNKFNLSLNSKISLSKFPTKKFKNRCIFTNRGRGIVTSFKMSRHEFSKHSKINNLPYLEKASW